MSSINHEQPPESTDIELKEYLNRMFVQIGIALNQSGSFIPLYVMPKKLKEGRIYYFGQSISPDITSAGYWGRTATGWAKLG